MQNIYQPKLAKIIGITNESIDTKLFRLKFKDKKIHREFDFLPGQFMQVGLADWGECPISLASSPLDSHNYFELAIRDVGSLSHQLHQLRLGDEMMIRGPFGNGFDIEVFANRPLILVGGGCGFIPLRSLIIDYLRGILKNTVLQIYYGCKNEDTLLFKKDYQFWKRHTELEIILEKPTKDWKGPKGMVTKIINQATVLENSVAVLVGPPLMYKYVVPALKKKNIKEENILVSLERRMHCGFGVCQHCAIGPYYVCKDGPVFNYSQIKDWQKIF